MIKISSDITYDTKRQLKVDIYSPAKTESDNKILLFWHGGGWFRGDKSNFKDLCNRIANYGFTVFVPNYSLAPENSFPQAHQDSIKFIKWLFKSDYLKNGHAKIAQIGASSGGTMALNIAGLYGFPTVAWSPPVSFSTWMKEHQEIAPSVNAQKEYGLTNLHDINNAFYKYFTLAYVGAGSEKVLQKLDARSYSYDNLSQLLIINSTDELSPIKYLLQFVAFLAKNNHAVDLKLIQGKRHAMSYAQQYLTLSLDYLSQALG